MSEALGERPSYWKAFLTHPRNRLLMLGTVAVSVLASIPFGGDALGLGLLGLTALQMIGLAVVPGLPSFQQAVDKRERAAQRGRQRERLMRELQAHGSSRHLEGYERMVERVGALYRTASDRSTTLTEREVEQLDDLTLDYLRMCLSDAVMRSTEGAEFVDDVNRKLRALHNRLQQDGLSADEAAQLQRAKAEYEEALARRSRILSRRSVLDASLVGMPVRMEEVFQMVMASPRDSNLTRLLEESVAKLQLAEDAAMDLTRDLDLPQWHPSANDSRPSAGPPQRGAAQATAAAAQRHPQGLRQ